MINKAQKSSLSTIWNMKGKIVVLAIEKLNIKKGS